MATVWPNQAIREWLADQSRRAGYDIGSWVQLVETDRVARAIEAAVRSGQITEKQDL